MIFDRLDRHSLKSSCYLSYSGRRDCVSIQKDFGPRQVITKSTRFDLNRNDIFNNKSCQ